MSRTLRYIVWTLLTLLTLLCFVVLLPSLFGLVMVTLLAYSLLDFATRRKRNAAKAFNSTLRAVCRHDGAITKVALAFSRWALRGPCYEFSRRLMMGQDPLEAASRSRVPLTLETAVAMQSPSTNRSKSLDQNRILSLGYDSDAFSIVDEQSQTPAYGQFVYLILTAVITCVVFSFMSLFVVPTIDVMFDEFGMNLPNRSMLSAKPAYWILFILCFVVIVAVPVMSRGTLLGIRFPNWFPMTPWLAQHKADVLSGLADAIEHGWPMGRVLAVGHMISIRMHERRSLQHAMELIEQGQSSAMAIHRAGWIDSTEAAWLEGASPPRTAQLLRTIADQTVRHSNSNMRWLMSLLFPAVVIVIGGAVLMFAHAFFSALFALIGGMA